MPVKNYFKGKLIKLDCLNQHQEADFVKAHTSEITLLPCGVRKYLFSLFVREIGVTAILNVKNIDFSTAGLWSKGTWLPEVTNFSIQATEKKLLIAQQKKEGKKVQHAVVYLLC